MPRPVSSIPNLGPASEAAFARAGIHSAEEIEAMGPDAAYERFLLAGNPPHFIGYYAMLMGLQGRPWNDCRGEEKARLRARFDAIKARVSAQATPIQGDGKLESVFDELGLRPKR
ncbi:TfoX/Sxy family protein [Defluviimonas sp. WL0002]|uniref:TfoX/Sxy family protein n=1 Tax=Albidovulum marisflavi TaxID=2984159 RepID=A0ABT2ZHL3_9RHOB|nr:TfoX/Sxy family protein [Defluviimonas sp. WL0002]MCV2870517.1 TfoX/Sxy family protein [Defluviimonas sp. WL0002]